MMGGTVGKHVGVWLLALSLGAGTAAAAAAQQRSISGRVTNAVSGQPVAGAVVSVTGAPGSVGTKEDGAFTISAPAGPVTLQVRFIGFKRRAVPVPADQNTVNVTLEEDIFNLEPVVVTGQATGLARRDAPAPSLEIKLAGRVPGANIQTNSGAPGGGVQVALRGTTSVFGAATPLYV